ncbi:MAG TPA: adenylate/guanylate cyclase domain-containing protein [Caldithrix abyssi]|uniref:Adenylate/guanylate cyclase domain-containing protein n=1 Tax=Caldithrix abyssi TaxID=187145 RepID=A0A7V5UEA6_CALAY|nr:adenylate/guanylate cyclase domain-containing protein [Caldithrix abyssi]
MPESQRTYLDEQKIKVILTRMHRAGIPKKLIASTYRFLIQTSPHELVLFNPYRLTSVLGCSRKEMLDLLVLGLFEGLFEMQWDISCPHCNGIAKQHPLIRNITPQVYCPTCKIDFETHADHNIRVSVSVHPQLVRGEPLKAQSPKSADEDQPFLTALELISLPTFRHYFSDQVPALDQSIKIRSVTVMFTDLIQSTRLYSNIGDLNAFVLVKEHFSILFDEIIENSGGVIKTIGDAVMAVFKEGEPAIRVAFAIKKEINNLLKKYDLPEGSGIKIGLARGTSLVVNLNNRADLFGTTVNMAARVVSVSNPDAVAVTEDVFTDLQIRNYIRARRLNVKKKQHVFKGIPGLQNVYLLYPQVSL